ncbi:hypothetical protein INR49_028814 [Caranx melampygus]|nr:hypothetical protein INR49_028814 [Caranx melampygus]
MLDLCSSTFGKITWLGNRLKQVQRSVSVSNMVHSKLRSYLSYGCACVLILVGIVYIYLRSPLPYTNRTDVNAVTNWNAPLVWEGTFDPVVIDAIYRKWTQGSVVVLAVGKYTRFLKGFLESDSLTTSSGHEENVPKIELGKGRNITVLDVPSATRWQDVVLSRMKWATYAIDKQIRKEADYVFMMDVDSVFHNRFGAESLSPLSAVLHRGYYKGYFPYERRPQSKDISLLRRRLLLQHCCCVGWIPGEMYKLVKYCYEQSEEDAKNKIEAAWQEESHLNR